jgi:hypothetical protein
MVTKLDLETFLEIPIHLPSDTSLKNSFQTFLLTNEISIDQLILQFLQDHEENLVIQLINRLQHFPGAYEELIQSNGFMNIINLGIEIHSPPLLFSFSFPSQSLPVEILN